MVIEADYGLQFTPQKVKDKMLLTLAPLYVYFQCDNGVTHTFTCPGGLEFDRNENVCNWPSAAANPPVPAYC